MENKGIMNIVDVHIKSRKAKLEKRRREAEMSQEDYDFFLKEIEDRENILINEIESGEIKDASALASRMDSLDQAVRQALLNDLTKTGVT